MPRPTRRQKSVRSFKRLIHSWDPAATELFASVRAIEHEGDLITHEVIDKLNRTFVTPIDREDIYTLIGQIDDVCDILQALSDRMQLYDLGDKMPNMMKQMADPFAERFRVRDGERRDAGIPQFSATTAA